MLNRAEESVYAMSRCVERAENLARLIDIHLQLVLDAPEGTDHPWAALIGASGGEAAFKERYGTPARETALKFLAFDAQNPDSILSSLRSARENAQGVRESISADMWQELNKAFLMAGSAAAETMDTDLAIRFFREVRLASHLFAGITDATLARGTAWHFSQAGRMLERAGMTARIVDLGTYMPPGVEGGAGTSENPHFWGTVLRSTSAFEMYRNRTGKMTGPEAAGFLLLDREFPRSVRFCLLAARDSLRAVTCSPDGAACDGPEKFLGQAVADIESIHAEDIFQQGLHEYTGQLRLTLYKADRMLMER